MPEKNNTEKLPRFFNRFRLLIDADIVAMRFACKHETPHRFPDNDQTLPEDPEAFTVRDEETAKKEAKEFIENLMYRAGTEDILLCFTGKNNWRKRVFPSYKHNRVGKWVPELRTTLTDYLMEEFHHLRVAELEADDLMGILQTELDGFSMICTIDKDLMQIPGWHYNWNANNPEPVMVEEDEADLWHIRQTLTGDATDGFPGCPGIGPKKAAAILADVPGWDKMELWSRVVTAYEQAGKSEQDALDNARMARILRHGDFLFQGGGRRKVKLWHPFGDAEWMEVN